jgi:phosphoribosylanthranilate isomerase
MPDFLQSADYFLLDTFVEGLEGGTGAVFDWEIAKKAKELNKPFFLAGGLTPENVSDAVDAVRPFGIDVAGGVERLPRRKDYEKLKSFISNARKA